MTDCPACGLKMGGTSCATGIDRWTIPDGEGSDEMREQWLANPWPCPDCGCPPGGMHHLGCDVERCPCGKAQAIACVHYNQRLQGGGP
jgi:hypothetical protein